MKDPLSLRFLIPMVVVAGVGFALWKFRKSDMLRFASLWFIINLLPVLNLGAFSEDFMVQGRYLYVPSLGFSLLLAVWLSKIRLEQWFSFSSRRAAQTFVFAGVLIALAGTTMAQNRVWKDDMTLWNYGVEAAPDQTMPYYILGHKYIRQNRPDKVVEALEGYVKVNPRNDIVLANLASAHLLAYEATFDRAHVERSIVISEMGLKLNGKNALLWDSLGHAYTYDTKDKNYDKARAYFARALQLQPENAVIQFHMGASYAMQGQNDHAIQFLEQARTLEPDFPDTYKFLAYAHQGKKNLHEALKYFSEYLQRSPNATDASVISQTIEKLKAQIRDDPA